MAVAQMLFSRSSTLPGVCRTLLYAPKRLKHLIRIGQRLPDVPVYEDSPNNPVSIPELYKGKKGVLFSVVGAFTPGCTLGHLPEYLENFEQFKAEGYDLVSCIAVNDPFVMAAWGRENRCDGKIRMLADPRGDFTRALGMELDCRTLMGNYRSKRYSVIVEDGVICGFNQEPDHTGLVCLLCIKTVKSTSTNR